VLTACSPDEDLLEPESLAIEKVVNDGMVALGNQLETWPGGSFTDAIRELDFSIARMTFNEARQISPSHAQANFGYSLSVLFDLCTDQGTGWALVDWSRFLADQTPYDPSTAAFCPLGIPLTFVVGNEACELPFAILPYSLLLGFCHEPRVIEANVGESQRILRIEVMPALAEVAALLDELSRDPEFVFPVTRRMQGELAEFNQEIDHADVLALAGGVKLLLASCQVAVAYEYNLDSLEPEEVVALLDRQDGPYLRLAADGRQLLQAVPGNFLGAVSDIEASITSLMAETDDQFDDILRTDDEGFDEQYLTWILDTRLERVRGLFGDGWSLRGDWDQEEVTPPLSLVFAVDDFLNDPVTDWKQVFPTYQVGVKVIPDFLHTIFLEEHLTAQIYSPTSGTRWASLEWRIIENTITSEYNYGSSILRPIANEIANAYVTEWRSLPNFSGNGFIDVYAYASVLTGYNWVDFWVEGYHSVLETLHQPTLTWDAPDFFAWRDSWTNHSLNGLLPATTDSAELLDIFGFNGGTWSQETPLLNPDLD
jgi:hypothetical protein